MFSKPPAPLPPPKITPPSSSPQPEIEPEDAGVIVGFNEGEPVKWDPSALPNKHVTGIGASGQGKTQLVKSLVFGLMEAYDDLQFVVIDLHGDQELPGETLYEINRSSPYGINLLTLDIDEVGGGPQLQTQAVANNLQRQYKLGTSQKSVLKSIIETCYIGAGIIESEPKTWTNNLPTFAEVEMELENLLEEAESARERNKLEGLQDKLSDVFSYGIFSREQPDIFSPRLVRLDLSALAKVDGLQAIAVDSVAKQLMDRHRLLGENSGESRYLVVDEARCMKDSKQTNDILRDGRKYSLSIMLFSQSERDLSADAISNASSCFVLGVTPSDLRKVANKFRFSEAKIAELKPLEALCRFGKNSQYIRILPFFERSSMGFSTQD